MEILFDLFTRDPMVECTSKASACTRIRVSAFGARSLGMAEGVPITSQIHHLRNSPQRTCHLSALVAFVSPMYMSQLYLWQPTGEY